MTSWLGGGTPCIHCVLVSPWHLHPCLQQKLLLPRSLQRRFGCDGRRSRDRAWPAPWEGMVPRAGQSCETSAPAVPWRWPPTFGLWGWATRAADSAESCPCLGTGCLRAGLRVGSPLVSHPAWNGVEKSPVELQSGLGAPPGSRGVAGQSCGMADGLAAHCCPGNCLSSPES